MDGQNRHASAGFYCSITHEIMEDPVILGMTGQTYERSIIELWLQTNTTDPNTKVELKENERVLTPNYSLRTSIEDWRRSVAEAKLGRILKTNELQEIKKVPVPVSSKPVMFQGKLTGSSKRDVMIARYPNHAKVKMQRQAEIMNMANDDPE